MFFLQKMDHGTEDYRDVFRLTDFFEDGHGYKPDEISMTGELEEPTELLTDLVRDIRESYEGQTDIQIHELYIVGSVAREGNGETIHPDVDFLIRPMSDPGEEDREALYLSITQSLQSMRREKYEVFVGTPNVDCNNNPYDEIYRINITDLLF